MTHSTKYPQSPIPKVVWVSVVIIALWVALLVKTIRIESFDKGYDYAIETCAVK